MCRDVQRGDEGVRAWPLQLWRMVRRLLVVHAAFPVGVGTPFVLSRVAMPERVVRSSRYQAKICSTIVAA